MDTANEARELLRAVKKALPNIDSYLRDVLRKEKLTPEAEALRARYEAMLSSLEKATTTVRHSIAVDPVGIASRQRGMLNRSKTEGEFLVSHRHLVTPEQPTTIPELSGPLLCRDENLRWHRRFCRLVPTEMSLYIHESDDSMKVLDIISLRKTTSTFAPDDIDKDHCFVIELIQSRSSCLEVDENFARFFFAAYTETEFTRWKSTVSRVQGLSHALSSSSIGQESMFSGGSGERESVLFGESDRNSFPLPNIPTESVQDDDQGSDCTIYEDIDELVQQFDLTMKATMDQVQQMNPSKKPKKTKGKKDREGNIVGKLKEEQRSQLQQGQEHNGFMYKRSGTGSWKKRWCVLRGCFFTFMKSPGSMQTHEYVLLRAEIQIVKDVKKQNVFRLACKGVPEIFLACDNEDDFREWVSLLIAASKRGDDLNGLVDDRPPEKAQPLPEGIYNVPRSSMDFTFQFPTSPLSEGIYDVPRSLAGSRDMLNTAGTEGTRSPFDIYDVPRSVMVPSPEADTIYDDPLDLDLGDMEIYDYPPDVMDLNLADKESTPGALPGDAPSAVPADVPNRNSGSVISNEYDSSHSQTPASGESTASSGSNRQSMIGSLGSMEDIPTNGPIQDGFRSLPLSTGRHMDSFFAGVTAVNNGPPALPNGPVPNSMSFSQYQIRGILHRKERFHLWSRCFCLIRNSFLECHKSNSSFNSGSKPLLKLFLLGSSVTDVPDVKKPFAFQVKHPRREGTLVFAADNENEYKRWMEAFASATNISVQQVETVDEMRINDSDLKKKWTTMEKDLNENDNKPSPSHGRFVRWRNSVAGSSSGDENKTNSLKRRALTSMSFHKKSLPEPSVRKEMLAVSNQALSPSAVDGDVDGSLYEEMKRSLSLDPIPMSGTAMADSGSSKSQIQSYAHRTMSPVGVQSFRGYLKVMTLKDDKWSRLWCILEDRTITCFVSQMKPNVVYQLSLFGSTITRADEECKRKHSFRVWNSEMRQCFFFSAYDEEECQNWFAEVTQGASIQTSQSGQRGEPNSEIHFFPKNPSSSTSQGRYVTHGTMRSVASVEELSEGGDSISSLPPTTAAATTTGNFEHAVIHHGTLKKRSEKHGWNTRYCRIQGGRLFMYYQATDETPITMVALAGSTIERVNLPHTELERFTFNLNVVSGRRLLLAAASDQDLVAWLRAIQQCQAPGNVPAATTNSAPQGDRRSRGNSWSFKSRPEMLAPKSSKSLKRMGQSATGITNRKLPSTQLESSQQVDQDMVIHIPAQTMADDATNTGFMDIQFDGVGPWLKHWCALYQNCLHIYLNKDASCSLRSIALQGCQLKSFAASAKKSYSFSLTMPGGKKFHLAATDHVDMQRWFLALDSASRVEDSPKPSGSDDGYVSLVAGNVELPKKNVELPKEEKAQSPREEEELQTLPFDSGEGKQAKKPLTEKDFKEKQMSVIGHYEKKIRKTQKVSKTTHESLIKQMETMRHLQQKFTEHSQKLQKNPKSGDAAGQRRLKEMQVKSHQITKILPYLEKYVQVNHQAEMQTLAILREGCAVDLQELENKYRSKAPVTPSIPRKLKKERVKSSSCLLDPPEKFNSLSRVKKSKRAKSHSSARKDSDTTAPKLGRPVENGEEQGGTQLGGGGGNTPPVDSAAATDSVAVATSPATTATPPPVAAAGTQVPPLLTEPEIPPLLMEPGVPPLLTEPELPPLLTEPEVHPAPRSSPLVPPHSVSPQPHQTRLSPIPVASPLPPSPSLSSSPVPVLSYPPAVSVLPADPFVSQPAPPIPGEHFPPLSVPTPPTPPPVTPPFVTPPLSPPPVPAAPPTAPPPVPAAPPTAPPPVPAAPPTIPPPPPLALLSAPPPPPIAPLTTPPTAPPTVPPPPPTAPNVTQPPLVHSAPVMVAPPPPVVNDDEEQYDQVITRSPPSTKPKPKRGNPDRHSLQYAELSVVHTNSPPLPASETMVDYAVVDLTRKRIDPKQAMACPPQSSPCHNGTPSLEHSSSLPSSHQHPKVPPLHHLNRSSSHTGNGSGVAANARNSFEPNAKHARNSVARTELSNLAKNTPSLAERMKAFQQ